MVHTPLSDGDQFFAAAMRLAGLGVAFGQRSLELQIMTMMYASREWARLLASVQEATEEIVAGAVPPLPGGPGPEPLTGRRKVPSRRSRSVVINFPDRRWPRG